MGGSSDCGSAAGWVIPCCASSSVFAQGWNTMKSIFGLHCLQHFVCGAAVMFAAPFASAQTPPNLVGTWKGKAEAVYVGPTPYRDATGPGPNFGDAMEYTYIVKDQKGTRFSGELTGKITETIIGTLRPPEFRSGILSTMTASPTSQCETPRPWTSVIITSI